MANEHGCNIKHETIDKQAAITDFPTPIKTDAFKLSNSEKVNLIEKKMRDILDILGLDLNDESIARTPCRIARMFVNEIFSGLNPDEFPAITLHPQKIASDEMILIKNINLISFCEHHFVPFEGVAHVAYLPANHIIGLSKINRIVQYFCRRPQLQERLTAQIADSLVKVLNTENVAVMITAKHYCVAARGVRDQMSSTTTHVFRGRFFTDSQKKSELIASIN